MIAIRKSEDRGHFDHGWLDTYHTFSFGDYHDRAHMAFRSLRVLNEDRVAPGMGFGEHGHRDMEIITYVLEGALEHRDGLGNGSSIRPGELQRMSAGTGIMHAEANPSATEPVHLLQIWIVPDRRGLPPGYEQRALDMEETRGRFRLVASPDGRDGALTVHQDVRLSLATLAEGESVRHELAPGRYAWVQVTRGGVDLNGEILKAGDGAAVSEETSLTIAASRPAEVLLFDLA